MVIEIGKFYRTRDNNKARIYALDGSSDYPIHGAILGEDGWVTETWILNGNYSDIIEMSSPFDIVAEWTDMPEIELSSIPVYKYVAKDKYGQVFLFEKKPEITNDAIWNSEGSSYAIDVNSVKNLDMDWKDSLHKIINGKLVKVLDDEN